MKSKYYKDKYIMLTQDLLNTSFKEDNILNIVSEEYNKINRSYGKYYVFGEYDNFNNKISGLNEEIKKRDDTLLEDFKEYFNLEKTHKVNVKANKGIQINFTNQELYQNEEYTNEYYTDIDLRYKYKEYPGYKFSYWLVNGEKIYDEELVIESEKYKDIKEINIEAVSEYQEKENHLLISEIYAKGDSDWIKITNTGKKDIDISNYYLSNKEDNLKKCQLPNKTLKQNESIVINGDKNYYAIGEYICNFNLKDGENVYISKDNTILEEIYIPRMSEIETYGRYDNSSSYKFFMNENNERKNIK